MIRARPAEMSAASPNRPVRSGVIRGRKLFGARLRFCCSPPFWPREKRKRVLKNAETLVKGNAYTGPEKEVAAMKRDSLEVPRGTRQLPTTMTTDSKVFSF